jgi:hypothetical protein
MRHMLGNRAILGFWVKTMNEKQEDLFYNFLNFIFCLILAILLAFPIQHLLGFIK